MPDTLPVSTPTSFFKQALKVVAVAASTGAALVTVFKALYSYGVIGEPESHETIGNLGAAWVGVKPAADTASSIGDTLHYVATISDRNGSILVGARPVWTIGDSSVATVLADGSVIARGPGATSVTVVVGSLVTRSRVVVKQHVADVAIVGDAGDTLFAVREGGKLHLQGRALDARGYVIAGLRPSWQIDDSSVAHIDSSGLVTGRNAGRTIVTATVGDVSARARLGVSTTATKLTAVAGMDQSALAGRTLSQAVVVRATNRNGAPAAGQLVTFRLPNGQGIVDLPAALTDADGRARTIWTLADYPGRQMLIATVENVDTALQIVADAEPVARNTRVGVIDDHQMARVGEVVPDHPGVRVTDSTSRALPDVLVRWSALNGGTVEALSARTDSLGVARARWTLGRRTGQQRLRAQVGGNLTRGIAPVSILATAVAGPPGAIRVIAGDAQRASAGTSLKEPLVFRVLDANGNGVASAPLVLSPSGGKLPESTLLTDSLGYARTKWTLGHSAGEYALAVHVDGIRKLTKLTARAYPAAAANLSFEDAPSKASGGQKTRRLFALVTDVYGNPVPDAKVRFAANSGTVSPARAVTDARGRVALTWTAVTGSREQRLTGAVAATDVTGAYIMHSAGDDPAKRSLAKRPAAPLAKAPVKTSSKPQTASGSKPAREATKKVARPAAAERPVKASTSTAKKPA